LAEELAVLKQLEELAAKGLSTPKGKNGFSRYNDKIPATSLCICNLFL